MCIRDSPNVLQQQARFDTFVDRYNRDRPHQALGMKVTSQMRSPTCVTPTCWPAKAWLRFTLQPWKQMRPQLVTVKVASWKGYVSSLRPR